MDVRCPQCQTLYELDPRKVSNAGTNLRCASCGHVFRAKVAEGASAGQWMIRRKADGEILYFDGLTTLQRWIIERKVERRDQISKTGATWKRVGDINELAAFFKVVDAIRRTTQGAAPEAPSGRIAAPAENAASVRRIEQTSAAVTDPREPDVLASAESSALDHAIDDEESVTTKGRPFTEPDSKKSSREESETVRTSLGPTFETRKFGGARSPRPDSSSSPSTKHRGERRDPRLFHVYSPSDDPKKAHDPPDEQAHDRRRSLEDVVKTERDDAGSRSAHLASSWSPESQRPRVKTGQYGAAFEYRRSGGYRPIPGDTGYHEQAEAGGTRVDRESESLPRDERSPLYPSGAHHASASSASRPVDDDDRPAPDERYRPKPSHRARAGVPSGSHGLQRRTHRSGSYSAEAALASSPYARNPFAQVASGTFEPVGDRPSGSYAPVGDAADPGESRPRDNRRAPAPSRNPFRVSSGSHPSVSAAPAAAAMSEAPSPRPEQPKSGEIRGPWDRSEDSAPNVTTPRSEHPSPAASSNPFASSPALAPPAGSLDAGRPTSPRPAATQAANSSPLLNAPKHSGATASPGSGERPNLANAGSRPDRPNPLLSGAVGQNPFSQAVPSYKGSADDGSGPRKAPDQARAERPSRAGGEWTAEPRPATERLDAIDAARDEERRRDGDADSNPGVAPLASPRSKAAASSSTYESAYVRKSPRHSGVFEEASAPSAPAGSRSSRPPGAAGTRRLKAIQDTRRPAGTTTRSQENRVKATVDADAPPDDTRSSGLSTEVDYRPKGRGWLIVLLVIVAVALGVIGTLAVVNPSALGLGEAAAGSGEATAEEDEEGTGEDEESGSATEPSSEGTGQAPVDSEEGSAAASAPVLDGSGTAATVPASAGSGAAPEGSGNPPAETEVAAASPSSEQGVAEEEIIDFDVRNMRAFDEALERGNSLLQQARPRDAMAAFESAASLDPGNPAPHMGIGRAYEAIGRPDLAIIRYERIVERTPTHGPAWFALGRLRNEQGRAADAILAFRRVIALDSESRDAERARREIEKLREGE